MVLNEKGWAMPLVLTVMVVVTLLGTALWQYSMTDLKHVSIEEKRMQAHYLARSGAQLVSDMGMAPDNYVVEFEGHDITVEVVIDGDGVTVITSTAVVDGIAETLILKEEYWMK